MAPPAYSRRRLVPRSAVLARALRVGGVLLRMAALSTAVYDCPRRAADDVSRSVPSSHRSPNRASRPGRNIGRADARARRTRSTTTTPTTAWRRSATCRSITRRDAGSRPRHLRSEDQARACGRQRQAHRAERPRHLRRDHQSQRRLPRRFRRIRSGWTRPTRPGWPPRRADRSGRQHHCPPKRRLHRVRGLRRRSAEAAEVAGQGRPDHSRSGRADDLFRGHSPRVLRRAARLYAVFLHARSDREAQDRLPDPRHSAPVHATASA